MRGIEKAEMVRRIAAASSAEVAAASSPVVAIEGKLFRAIRAHPEEVRLHRKLRSLRLQPGEMCWCRITDIARLSRGGWRPLIVEADIGELAVFADMTGQLALMSKRTFATSHQPAN